MKKMLSLLFGVFILLLMITLSQSVKRSGCFTNSYLQVAYAGECSGDEDCPAGYRCVNGTCVKFTPTPECDGDEDCPQGYKCVNGKCKLYTPVPSPTKKPTAKPTAKPPTNTPAEPTNTAVPTPTNTAVPTPTAIPPTDEPGPSPEPPKEPTKIYYTAVPRIPIPTPFTSLCISDCSEIPDGYYGRRYTEEVKDSCRRAEKEGLVEISAANPLCLEEAVFRVDVGVVFVRALDEAYSKKSYLWYFDDSNPEELSLRLEDINYDFEDVAMMLEYIQMAGYWHQLLQRDPNQPHNFNPGELVFKQEIPVWMLLFVNGPGWEPEGPCRNTFDDVECDNNPNKDDPYALWIEAAESVGIYKIDWGPPLFYCLDEDGDPSDECEVSWASLILQFYRASLLKEQLTLSQTPTPTPSATPTP